VSLWPLVTTMQGVLSTVGAARFCQMVDRVANPNDWSLASEVSAGLARGARLEAGAYTRPLSGST
jgi:hypothetical protein